LYHHNMQHSTKKSVANFLLCSVVIALACHHAPTLAAPSPQRQQPQRSKSLFQSPEYQRVLQKLNFTLPQIGGLIQSVPFKLGPGVNGFGSNLMSHLLADTANEVKNVVFSPFSVHVALSMLFYASPKDSRTHDQISRALGLDAADSSQYLFNYLRLHHYYDQIRTQHNAEVKLANRILIDQHFSVKPDFQTVLEGFYLTSVGAFESVRQAEQSVNDFVSLKTERLIEEVLAPGSLDSLTRMILVNVIYYRANWKHRFDVDHTEPMVFNLLGGHEKIFHIRGMNLRGSKWLRAAINVPQLGGAKVLELPYENDDFNMYIGLPHDNSLEALNKLARGFKYSAFADHLVTGKLGVRMPAFDAGFSADLKAPLRSMGLEDMFDDYLADFKDMTEEPVAVTKVAHQAVVKVDEEGSEAAAVTAVVLGSRSGGVPSLPFVVDRPFVFMIHDKVHDIPLFMGRMVNPAGQDNPGATIHHSGGKQSEKKEESSFANVVVAAAAASAPFQISHEEEEEVFGDYDTEHAELGEEKLEAGQELPLPDCGTLGYEETGDDESVSFPCKGRDTLPIERHNSEVERQRRKALEKALKHK